MPLHDLTTPVTAPGGTANLAAIQKQLDDILADDANDDKAAAALKAVVDAIKPYDDTALRAKNVAQDSAITDLKLADATTDSALKVLSNKIDGLPKPKVILTNGAPPDGDWLLAVDVRKIGGKRITRLWAQVEVGVAKPIAGPFEDVLPAAPTHNDAVVQPDGSYRMTVGGVQLDYRTTLNAQNELQMVMAFPAGTLSRVDVEGQDSAGTALELGGQAVPSAATTLTLNQFFGNVLVVKALWKLTYRDGSVVNYLVPLTR